MALTKSEIRSKINSLSRQKAGYEGELSKYKTSYSHANKLVSKLNFSLNYLTSSNDYMKRFFTISNKTADGGKIVEAKEQVNQMVKKMNTSIIPEINKNISNLNTKITRIEREIRELRRQYETAEE